MPLLAIPPELKKITPFVRRAEELDRDRTAPESRLVAYYCRQYAVHIGIPFSTSSPAAKVCLGHLLETLEKEKVAMDNFTRDEAAYLCRKFAMTVFDKADAVDRAGNASKDTAKTFYAAASFLQILEQFSADDDTSEEVTEDKRRIIYAKWKATEIIKAFKEGRQPTPGGYGEGMYGDEMEITDDIGDVQQTEKKMDAPTKVITVKDDDDDDDDDDNNNNGNVASPKMDLFPPVAPFTAMRPMGSAIPPNATDFQPPKHEIQDEEGTEVELGPPPAYPSEKNNTNTNESNDVQSLAFNLPPPIEPKALPPLQPNEVISKQASPKAPKISLFGFGKKSNAKASKAQIADAIELTRFALAALEDKDAELAAERLQQALQSLGR